MWKAKHFIIAKNMSRHINQNSYVFKVKSKDKQDILTNLLNKWKKGKIDNFVELNENIEHNGLSTKSIGFIPIEDQNLTMVKVRMLNIFAISERQRYHNISVDARKWIHSLPNTAEIPFERRKVIMDTQKIANLFIVHRCRPFETVDNSSPFVLMWNRFEVQTD